MTKMKKLISMFLVIIMALSINVFAVDKIAINSDFTQNLSEESIRFLAEHDVDMNIFNDVLGENLVLYNNTKRNISYKRSIDEIVKAVKEETNAYKFTDEQIEQLINSSVHSQITFIVPDEADLLNISSDLNSQNRPTDDGVGYEIESIAGFHTTTAVAKLPTVYPGIDEDTGSIATDVAGYMFWTVSDKIDIGLCYSRGFYGDRWRFCWLYAGGELQTPQAEEEQTFLWLQTAEELYLRVSVVDNEWLLFEMFNKEDFSQEKAYSVYIGGLGITRTNAKWRRQITLCTSDKDSANNVKFDGGAYLRNAEFSECYIYSGSGTSGVTTRTVEGYVNPTYCGKFGIDNNSRNFVDVEAYTEWYSEKINIQFPNN